MSRFHDLGKRLAEPCDDENDDTPPPDKTDGKVKSKPKPKEDEMSDTNAAAIDAATKEATATAIKAERARNAAVMASDHYAGREKTAQHLLANTDMSAEAIVSTLATVEMKPGATLSEDQQRAAAEEGARKEMQAQLEQGRGNSGVDASGGKPGGADGKQTQAEVDAMYDRAHARLGLVKQN